MDSVWTHQLYLTANDGGNNQRVLILAYYILVHCTLLFVTYTSLFPVPCRYRTDQQRCLWQLTMAILIWSDCYSTKGPISTLSMMCVKSINTSHPIISYHIVSYDIESYHIISRPIISYHILSYDIVSYPIISYHILSYHILLSPSVCLSICLSMVLPV